LFHFSILSGPPFSCFFIVLGLFFAPLPWWVYNFGDVVVFFSTHPNYCSGCRLIWLFVSVPPPPARPPSLLLLSGQVFFEQTPVFFQLFSVRPEIPHPNVPKVGFFLPWPCSDRDTVKTFQGMGRPIFLTGLSRGRSLRTPPFPFLTRLNPLHDAPQRWIFFLPPFFPVRGLGINCSLFWDAEVLVRSLFFFPFLPPKLPGRFPVSEGFWGGFPLFLMIFEVTFLFAGGIPGLGFSPVPLFATYPSLFSCAPRSPYAGLTPNCRFFTFLSYSSSVFKLPLSRGRDPFFFPVVCFPPPFCLF